MDDVSCWQKSKGSILLIISAQLKSHHPMAGKNISLSKLQQLVSSVWKHLVLLKEEVMQRSGKHALTWLKMFCCHKA